MSLKVKAFNDDELKQAIKESSPIIKSYIGALKRVSDGWRKMVEEMVRDKNSNAITSQNSNQTISQSSNHSNKSEQSAKQIWK